MRIPFDGQTSIVSYTPVTYNNGGQAVHREFDTNQGDALHSNFVHIVGRITGYYTGVYLPELVRYDRNVSTFNRNNGNRGPYPPMRAYETTQRQSTLDTIFARSSAKLSLFPVTSGGTDSHHTDYWVDGTIYHFAMYNRSLSDQEVEQNFQAGLPNSMPVIRDSVVKTVIEDSLLLINVTDIYDFDVDQFKKNQSLTWRITSPPTRGELINNTYFKHLPFTSGNNYATIGITPSDPIVDGREVMFTIHVTHVNHPPTALNVTERVVLNRGVTIVLQGRDDDPGDLIINGLLLEPPLNGRLFTSTTGPQITVFPVRVQTVFFVPTPVSSVSGRDILATGSFKYKINDQVNDSLNVATCNITVHNNVQPGVLTNERWSIPLVAATEDVNASITLKGFDTTGFPVTFFVTHLPDKGRLLRNNQALNLTQSHTTLVYQPNQDANGNDSFEYYVQSTSGIRSAPGIQSIAISSVNDPPVLSSISSITMFGGTSSNFNITVQDVDSFDQFQVQYNTINGFLVGFDPVLLIDVVFIQGVANSRSGKFTASRNTTLQIMQNVTIGCGIPKNGSIDFIIGDGSLTTDIRIFVTCLTPSNVVISATSTVGSILLVAVIYIIFSCVLICLFLMKRNLAHEFEGRKRPLPDPLTNFVCGWITLVAAGGYLMSVTYGLFINALAEEGSVRVYHMLAASLALTGAILSAFITVYQLMYFCGWRKAFNFKRFVPLSIIVLLAVPSIFIYIGFTEKPDDSLETFIYNVVGYIGIAGLVLTSLAVASQIGDYFKTKK
jgi:hypothetical protein